MPKTYTRRAKDGYRVQPNEDLSGPAEEYVIPCGKIFTIGQGVIDLVTHTLRSGENTT